MTGLLDMRMNPEQSLRAADLLAQAEAGELKRIVREYGEERWAALIAREIVKTRASEPLIMTRQLAELVSRCVPGGRIPQRIHPATRVFQALRIAVNGELEALQAGLTAALQLLTPGGRLAVISFHTSSSTVAVGAASETDTAQTLARSKTKAVTHAASTEAAQAITARIVRTIAVTHASETSTAQAITRSKTRAVTHASETDAAQALGRSKTTAVTHAAETDAAQDLARARFYAVLHASETSSAQGITVIKVAAVGHAAEPDSAQTITRYQSAAPVLSAATVINITTTTATPRVTVTF